MTGLSKWLAPQISIHQGEPPIQRGSHHLRSTEQLTLRVGRPVPERLAVGRQFAVLAEPGGHGPWAS
jgi:hypothetical protein